MIDKSYTEAKPSANSIIHRSIILQTDSLRLHEVPLIRISFGITLYSVLQGLTIFLDSGYLHLSLYTEQILVETENCY